MIQGQTRDFQAWASSDSFRHAHAKRASEAAKPESQQPAHGGNKVTIYKVAVSHLPEAAAETV